jgi:hypothetical protein
MTLFVGAPPVGTADGVGHGQRLFGIARAASKSITAAKSHSVRLQGASPVV